MIADATAGGCERHAVLDNPQGVRMPALGDQRHVTLNAYPCWTGVLAGGGPLLGDPVSVGHRLGIALEDRLALSQVGVELVGKADRADLRAEVAGGAFIHIHVAWGGVRRYLEVARLPAEGLNGGVGKDLYVGVPSAFGQLGGDDAHGAIVGG